MGPIIAGALGTLGAANWALGKLGGGKRKSAGGGMIGEGQAALKRLRGMSPDYADLTGSERSRYDEAQAMFGPRLKKTLGHMESDPYSGPNRSLALAESLRGTTEAYQGAKANLSADLARRGLGASGELAGGLSGIESAHASAVSAAGQDAAVRSIQRRDAMTPAMLDIVMRVLQDGRGGTLAGLDGQADIERAQVAALFGQGNAESARSDDEYRQLMQLLSFLGQGGGSLIGRSGSTAPGSTPPFNPNTTYGPAF